MTRFSLFIAGCALALSAGTASAFVLECQQTRISRAGFTSLRAARTFFPERVAYQIEGERVVSSYYGQGTVTEAGGQWKMRFPLDVSGGQSEIIMRIDVFQSSLRYSATFTSGARFQTITGAGGVCQARN